MKALELIEKILNVLLLIGGLAFVLSVGVALVLAYPTLGHAEALENVAPAKRLAQCNEWLSDHNAVGIAAKQGHCDEMKELNKAVEGVNDDRRAKITRLTNEVCASKDIEAWFAGYAQQCMGNDGKP